jgi:hypothetical protein
MTTTTPDNDLARTYASVAGMGVVLALGALSFLGVSAAVGALVGALMAGLSLVALARAVTNLVAGGRSSWALLAAFKFAFLLVLTYWLLESRLVPALGLALGFGALPLGIFFSTLVIPAPGTHGGLSVEPEPTRKD